MGLEDHARVVVQATRDAQVDLQRWRRRRKQAHRFHGGREVIQCLGREAVAFEQRPCGLDGFCTARSLAEGAQQVKARRIEAFGLEQGGQTGLVALVEEAHRRSRRRFLAFGGFGAEAKASEHVAQQANMPDAERPAFESRSGEHAHGKGDHFGVHQRT